MQRHVFWTLTLFLLCVFMNAGTLGWADSDKLPKPKKLVQAQKKIKEIEKEIKKIENGDHKALKAKVEESDKLGDEVDAAREEWEKASKKLDEKTRKELLERVTKEPDKRIGDYMETPKDISKTDFYICIGAAKKLVGLQAQYDELDGKLVDEMDKMISHLEKKLEKPTEELEDILPEYQEQVLLTVLAECKGYKDKDAAFPVEELTKRVEDLRKLYKSDFNWTEDDVWNQLEDAWDTARPCLPKADREKSARKTSQERTKNKTAKRREKDENDDDDEEEGGKGKARNNRSTARLKPGERMVKKLRGVEFAFRWCPPGKFLMGETNKFNRQTRHGIRFDSSSISGRPNEQHEVTLTKGFWMLESEVTQRMWASVMGRNPSVYQGLELPVENVSWIECEEFCRKLSDMLEISIQLPTEAQWEYACRAGTLTNFCYGDEEEGFSMFGNSDDNQHDNAEKTAPVKSYKPNALGLYDMHGNVWEWCSDYYSDILMNTPATDPTGPEFGNDHIMRGGSWKHWRIVCRSALRDRQYKSARFDDIGFRVVSVPENQPVPTSKERKDRKEQRVTRNRSSRKTRQNAAVAMPPLTIMNAWYGSGNRQVDVTRTLQSLYRGSRVLNIGSYNQVFGDPCPHWSKRLVITFMINQTKQIQTMELHEDQVIVFPVGN